MVIDASHPLQPPPGAGHDGLDSAALSELRRWATGHPIAVVCLLRTRKAPAMDPHEAPANALFACADAVLLLDQDDGGPTLDVCGRDVSEKQMALSFDKGRWSLQGEAADLRLSAERQNILDVLRDHNQTMTPKEIAEVLDVPSRNVRQLLFQHAQGRRGDHALEDRLPHRRMKMPITSITSITPTRKTQAKTNV